MRRRRFIVLTAGLGATWPLMAGGQPANGLVKIGILNGLAENDPEMRVRLQEFTRQLARLGWEEGRNAHIEQRWVAGDVDRLRAEAHGLVELRPNVILVGSAPGLSALLTETHTIPIVFVTVTDPV